MAEYLKIVLQNMEPVRISDDSTSQIGQTATLRYIPGTVFRGIVVNELAKEKDFEEIKKILFSSKVRYLNAYPTDGERELLPSFKGFYEDKRDEDKKNEDKKDEEGEDGKRKRKKLQNVVINGTFEPGCKRAALGSFCYVEGESIHYYNVDTGSDMKIKINLKEDEKQNVFRNEYIAAGYVFTGYIAVEEKKLKDRLKRVFDRDIIIGNGRYAGLGKCRILSCDYVDSLPYQEYMAKGEQEGSCYMMLVSHTVMRDGKGEYCGLDLKKLGEQMGVDGLDIEYCATSVIDVKGYNRKWGGRVPSVMMYEQGSVFHLKYTGTLTGERMADICNRGIGVRRNEGFGRVLFLEDYETAQYKKAGKITGRIAGPEEAQRREEDGKTLQIAARGYYRNRLKQSMNRYVVEHPIPKGRLTNSQLGTLESLATAYKYEPEEARKVIAGYLSHADEKGKRNKKQKEKQNIRELSDYVFGILDAELDVLLGMKESSQECIMGIPKSGLFTQRELDKMKLDLVIKMIRYDYKKPE